MYHVSAQGVDERMINVHYYYYRGEQGGGGAEQEVSEKTEMKSFAVLFVLVSFLMVTNGLKKPKSLGKAHGQLRHEKCLPVPMLSVRNGMEMA